MTVTAAPDAPDRRVAGADVDTLIRSTWAALRPPPKISLSEWADKNFVLSSVDANPGEWTTLPHQRGILDAIGDPKIQRVTVIKSARVGLTKMLNIAIAYHMAEDPCSMMMVQPTVEDAEGYSKEEVAPMLRDVPALEGLVSASARSTTSTILEKHFPGGLLSMCGTNSGRGFRRVSRRVVLLDEVDGYSPSAGNEGDPVKLAEQRAASFWDRKIVACSTPLIEDTSRIAKMFAAGDRRRYYVPCPTCGHMDFFRFTVRTDDADQRGHRMRYDNNDPRTAAFQCAANGCVIEETSKIDMLERGEWRAEGEFDPDERHASFHLWAAYSTSPNARWSDIVREFLETKGHSEQLKTFVTTWLGETWKERGEAPDYQTLYDRREPYEIGSIPSPKIIALTCGTDVQKDRIVWEIVGWARNKENWSIDKGELTGNTALDSTWAKFEAEVINREFAAPDGGVLTIASSGIDSGYNTQHVYNFARGHTAPRVIAVDGRPGWGAIVGPSSPVDVTVRGRRIQRGLRIFPVGGSVAKQELYAWLKLRRGEDGEYPAGYCHFPEYDLDFFMQLTAEHLVKHVNRETNQSTLRFEKFTARENHYLDCRVYARAAVALLGLDRLPAREPPPSAAPASPAGPAAPRPSSWLNGGRAARGRASWLKPRR